MALAGGTALARVGAVHGARRGFGASLAAMLETVAIMGPARFGVPLTQAVSAPLLGAMEGRGRGPGAPSSPWPPPSGCCPTPWASPSSCS